MTDDNENKEAAVAAEEAPDVIVRERMDPVRKWTLIVIGACVVLMI